jgi:hypothetical protein
VYIRQSTPDQVKYNLESKRLQYGLADRARTLGWQDVDIANRSRIDFGSPEFFQ